jgi:lipid-A-disaccharide synthase-like uncharacterized protein
MTCGAILDGIARRRNSDRRQAGGFTPGRPEIKPEMAKEALVCKGPLVGEPWTVMNSLQFLAETQVFGILIHPWKIVGLTGSLVFGLRFLIQWIASEKAKKSVIPFGFWECSALGSLLMLSYFAIYQRDSVGVISTAMPLPIYLRNLYFRYTHRAPQHPGNAPRPPE